MAKTQTFGDKVKKQKQQDNRIAVKVIKAVKSDNGSTKFIEQIVKVDDIDQVEKVQL